MIVFKYLTKEIYSNMLVTTFLLLALLICNQFVQYLSEAAAGRLPIRAVMELMSLQLPMLLGLMLPLGLFVGVMLALGRLYVDREMTVLFACGMSKLQLVGMVMSISAVIMLVVGILMCWVQPKIEWYKHHIFQTAIRSSPLERIFPGQFESLENGKWVVYIDQLSRNHKSFKNVFIAEKTKKGLSIISAANGKQIIDPKTKAQYIVLANGSRFVGNPGEKQVKLLQFKEYGMRVSLKNGPITKKVQAMPTAQLWQLSGKDRSAEAELEWRLSLPISVLLLGLIAVSLSEVKPRKGRYAQLLPAILVYIVYADLLFVGRAWLRKGKIPQYFGLWWVHVLILFIAIILLWRFLGMKKRSKRLGLRTNEPA